MDAEALTDASRLPKLETFFAEFSHFAERISPDGQSVAYLGPDSNGVNRLWSVTSNHPERAMMISPALDPPVVVFFWMGDGRLLWQTLDPSGKQRIFTGAPEGGAVREILREEKHIISLIGVNSSFAPSILLGLSDVPTSTPKLYRYFLDGDGSPELLFANPESITTWAWDEKGLPVAALRWTASGAKEVLRVADGIATVVYRSDPENDLRLLFASLDGSRAFILTNRDSDLTRLECLDLSTGKTQVLASDPLGKVDLEEILVDDTARKVLGVGYYDGGVHWQAHNAGFRKLLADGSHLPGSECMTCLGCDAEMKHWLVKCFSAHDPGTIFHYNADEGSFRLLWKERSDLDTRTLSETKAIEYAAKDGTKIPGYLTLPKEGSGPWPLIVFPHGGPRMRTRAGYDGRTQFLASRGYAVFQPNYRGSRGYGKNFMNAGDRQWGRGVMQTDLTDGVDYLVNSGVAVKKRVAILGGSYGGYAALAGLTFTPDLYKAGISLFGISDLLEFADVTPTEWQVFVGDTWRRLGDPSTPSGRAALADLSPVNHVREIKAPLLIYHGAKDNLVPVAHTLKMVSAMQSEGKKVDCLIGREGSHGFSKPESEMAVYRAIELFLHEHLGGSLGPSPSGPVELELSKFRSK